MKEYVEDENIQEEEFSPDLNASETNAEGSDFDSDFSASEVSEDEFSPDLSASEVAAEGPSEFDSDFTEGGADYAGLDDNYGLGDDNFESDFSGLDHNYGLGDDNFETNLWEQDESDDSSVDGYWEPPQDTTDDWGEDTDTSSSDDWEGGEGDGGGWGTDGGDFTDSSADFDAGDTSSDTTE